MAIAGELALERGPLRVTLALDPLVIDVRRGRRLVHGMSPWAVDGQSQDRFLHRPRA